MLLYELLTGKTPFDPKTLLESGVDEMRRTLREKEPPRPSAMLTIAGRKRFDRHRRAPPRRTAQIDCARSRRSGLDRDEGFGEGARAPL